MVARPFKAVYYQHLCGRASDPSKCPENQGVSGFEHLDDGSKLNSVTSHLPMSAEMLVIDSLSRPGDAWCY